MISDISASVDGIFIPITPVEGSDTYQASYIRLYTRNNKKMADISMGIAGTTTGNTKATYNSSLFPYRVIITGAGVLAGAWEPIVLYITGGTVAVLGVDDTTPYVCCGATVVLG